MPRRLTVIAGLYILLGSAALLEVARGFFGSSVFNMDVTVFLLPVGIGLLHRRRSSRVWATFWAGFYFAALLGLSVYLTFVEPTAAEFKFFGMVTVGPAANLMGWVLTGVVGLASAAVIWTLYTQPVSLEFARTPQRYAKLNNDPDDVTGMPV